MITVTCHTLIKSRKLCQFLICSDKLISNTLFLFTWSLSDYFNWSWVFHFLVLAFILHFFTWIYIVSIEPKQILIWEMKVITHEQFQLKYKISFLFLEYYWIFTCIVLWMDFNNFSFTFQGFMILAFSFALQSERLHKVLQYVNEVHLLCGVLGLDFAQTVSDVDPSLHRTNQEQSTNISNGTFEGLEQTINKLKTERRIRIQKVFKTLPWLSIDFSCEIWSKTVSNLQLRDTVAALFELWNLMDSPQAERNVFSRATSVLRLSEAEVTEPGVLSTEIIEQVWPSYGSDFLLIIEK